MARVNNHYQREISNKPEYFYLVAERLDMHEIVGSGFKYRQTAEGKEFNRSGRFSIKTSQYIRHACPRLHSVLIGGKYKIEEILPCMDRFQFKDTVPLKAAKKRNSAASRAHSRLKRAQVDMSVEARKLDRASDWDLVK